MVNIDEIIANKLNTLGIDPSSIKPNIKKHLVKIESVLTPKFTVLTHSIEGIKGNPPFRPASRNRSQYSALNAI